MGSEVFYSQFGEDQYIYQNYLNRYRKDGVFLELGALDGVYASNTKFFEDNLGYSGVLIEPSGQQFERLVINRPTAKCHNLAVSNSGADFVEFIGGQSGTNFDLVGGLAETMSDAHLDNWYKGVRKTHKVRASRLSKVLSDSNIEYIDFFSLDVEGGEYEVLASMNWDIPVGLILIEMHDHSGEKNEKCRSLLREHNFSLDGKVAVNEIWINQNYFRKKLLSKGPFFSLVDRVFSIIRSVPLNPKS